MNLLPLFFDLCERARENRLTPEDTLTLLKHPEWIDQIKQSNDRYEFLKNLQKDSHLIPFYNILHK
jgi:hypothetical protein